MPGGALNDTSGSLVCHGGLRTCVLCVYVLCVFACVYVCACTRVYMCVHICVYVTVAHKQRELLDLHKLRLVVGFTGIGRPIHTVPICKNEKKLFYFYSAGFAKILPAIAALENKTLPEFTILK